MAIFTASNVTLSWYLLPYIKIFYILCPFLSWDVNHVKVGTQTITHAVSSQRKARGVLVIVMYFLLLWFCQFSRLAIN